jgi:HaeIII restriction endonuclease
MNMQTINGRAFEWAVGYTLQQKTKFQIEKNANSELNETAFNNSGFTEKKKLDFLKSAAVAVEHILTKEAIFIGSNKKGVISFNSDSTGQEGDVRDVLITVENKTIGISCKNNHNALKHPRLSGKANFIKDWGIDESGCSDEYWSKIIPIFNELAAIKKESNNLAQWKNLTDKAARFYWPTLDAWADELRRVCKIDTAHEVELCRTIISFIIGKFDFYKIIRKGKKRVVVQGFNLNKTLSTKQTKYPTCINAINNKNGGQYSKTIIFNHGYSINFRIHNAETLVIPSLKFDVKAIGLPVDDIYQQTFDI